MRCEQHDCDFDLGHEGGHGIYVNYPGHTESCLEPGCVLEAGHEPLDHKIWEVIDEK